MNDAMIQGVWLTHLASTLYMVGLIWFVQIVHYPMLRKVGISEFQAYEQLNVKRTTWAVSPMLFEFLSAFLLIWMRPSQIPAWACAGGFMLLLIVWLSTALIQVPCHQQLEQGFDIRAHRRLVRSNWIRTICWSLRGLLVLWMAAVTT